jgi:hypothetical protein
MAFARDAERLTRSLTLLNKESDPLEQVLPNPGPPKSYLTDHVLRPYPAVVTDISRRSYFYGFFYYGFPLAGRDWRRTRE